MQSTTTSISRITGYVLLAMAALVIIIVVYRNSVGAKVPVVFSSKDMISATWSQYKTKYMEQGTYRVIDTERNNVTTSEAESYAMLRSVWIDDHGTFDQSWQWTKDNMQHKNDALFSWLFGRHSNNTYGVLSETGGQNSASDADTDIALSLLFAYSRWQDTKYLDEAKKIVADVWAYDVVTINGKPYMAANDLERNNKDFILINPSYFAPYAYRIFAAIDTTHNWNALVDTSYDILERSITSNLDKKTSAYIAPDWITLSRSDTSIGTVPDKRFTTDYSYDALRIPWRLQLDWNWYKDNRAEAILKQMSFFETEWKANRLLHSDYTHDGKVVTYSETPATYGGTLAVFMAINSDEAKRMYEDKLLSLYSPDSQSWRTPLGYYNENWVWFGVALYNNYLPNLFIK